MCSNATKSVYKRREQFLENLSLWHLCRTAVRINGVTIFRAARCLDTQEHDVHFQKLLQNAAKKSPFGWLWDALRQRKKNLTVSQSHPRLGQAEILFALATLCGELWERFGFERIWHIIALIITLHSCAIFGQIFFPCLAIHVGYVLMLKGCWVLLILLFRRLHVAYLCLDVEHSQINLG